jgi:hypothetical protein
MGATYTHYSAATAAVTDQFVTSTNMVRGTYGAPANSGAMPGAGARHVTLGHADDQGTDNPLGTVAIVGTDLGGQVITETLTPVANTTVATTKWFKTVTAVTGGNTWVTNGNADHVVVGCGAEVIAVQGNGRLVSVVVNTTAAGTITLFDAKDTIGILKVSIGEGIYPFGVDFVGWLGVALGAASDVTVIHSDQGSTA